MYNKIYDFCKVRNEEHISNSANTPTQESNFNKLIESEGIPYEMINSLHQE
jgi:hypothetical protein